MIVNFTDISSGNPDNTADALLIPFMLQRYHEIGPLLDNLSEEDEVSIKETFNIDIQGVKNLAEELKKYTDIDAKKCIIAVWHDESYLNRYLLSNRNFRQS